MFKSRTNPVLFKIARPWPEFMSISGPFHLDLISAVAWISLNSFLIAFFYQKKWSAQPVHGRLIKFFHKCLICSRRWKFRRRKVVAVARHRLFPTRTVDLSGWKLFCPPPGPGSRSSRLNCIRSEEQPTTSRIHFSGKTFFQRLL